MLYAILVLMTYLGAQASVFFKKMAGCGSVLQMLSSRYLYLGCSMYLIAALFNIYVLHQMEYSKVLPLTSITYVWTMVLSYLVFKEKIGARKILGVSFIISGAVMIAL
jgi:drug/metabolite transporter (DMT)-like permease